MDDEEGLISRPPGVMIDTGGTGKGLCADAVAYRLRHHTRFVVDCGGDIAVGGVGAQLEPYAVEVQHPLTGRSVGQIRVARGGIATSGLNVRLWQTPDGRFAHHLLDPSTGEPAWTEVDRCDSTWRHGPRGGDLVEDGSPFRTRRRSPRARCQGRRNHPRLGPSGGDRPGPKRDLKRARSSARCMSGASPLHYLWWLVSRASGVVALVLISISVLLGLTMAAGALRRRGLKRNIARVHEHLAMTALIAVGVHGLSLLGDGWLRPACGRSPCHSRSPTGHCSQVSASSPGYGAVLVGPSFYLRRQLGRRDGASSIASACSSGFSRPFTRSARGPTHRGRGFERSWSHPSFPWSIYLRSAPEAFPGGHSRQKGGAPTRTGSESRRLWL